MQVVDNWNGLQGCPETVKAGVQGSKNKEAIINSQAMVKHQRNHCMRCSESWESIDGVKELNAAYSGTGEPHGLPRPHLTFPSTISDQGQSDLRLSHTLDKSRLSETTCTDISENG